MLKGVGKDMIACVDADYDFLRQGTTVDVGLLGHGLWLIGVGVRLRHDGIGHGRGLG